MTAIPLRYLVMSALLHAGLVAVWQWAAPVESTAMPAPPLLYVVDAATIATTPRSDTSPAVTGSPPQPAAPAPQRGPATGAATAHDAVVAVRGAELAVPRPDAPRAAEIGVAAATDAAAAPVVANAGVLVATTPATGDARHDTATTATATTATDTAATADTAAGANADTAANATANATANTAAALEAGVRTRQLEARLRSALSVHKVYPALAYRNGWQGEVTVGLRITADGRLRNVRVIASSGYGVLDRAALASLGEVERLDGVGWLGGGYFDMVLPIHYRLIDG